MLRPEDEVYKGQSYLWFTWQWQRWRGYEYLLMYSRELTNICTFTGTCWGNKVNFKRYYLQRVLMQHSTTQHIFDVSHVGEKWIYGRVWNKVRPRTTILVVLLAVLMLYLLLRKPEKRMEVHTHACACKTHKKGHARTLTQIPIKWTCPHVHFWRCDKLGDMFHIDLHFESESEASSCLIPLIVEIHCQTKHKTTSITLCVLKATT